MVIHTAMHTGILMYLTSLLHHQTLVKQTVRSGGLSHDGPRVNIECRGLSWADNVELSTFGIT